MKDVLQELIAQIKEAQARPDVQGAVGLVGPDQRVAQARVPEAYKNSDRGHQAAVRGRREAGNDARRDCYITSDVGQHQMWAAQFYKFDEPRRWINSGGLGTMGVGLPYAMGIKLAKPDADVFCITGEGSIQMNIQELSTCSSTRRRSRSSR